MARNVEKVTRVTFLVNWWPAKPHEPFCGPRPFIFTPPPGADWSYPVVQTVDPPFARPIPSYVASVSSPKLSEVFTTGTVGGGTYVIHSVSIYKLKTD